ncbi:Protein spt2 [Leucoagaricus sp. SymC.cos]|nr:Protein spt2 [Leucoagaricus sp. SymC.cos]
MSSFTALMALSASKTQEQNNLVQLAIQERQRKEQLQRKRQAEQEAKQREMEAKMRLKHFEDEKREQDRRKKMEESAKAREVALQRKKDEQRDALLYGPKKTSSKSSSSSSGGAGSKERKKVLDDDDDDSLSGSVLTREELRERKQQAEMRRIYGSTKRYTTTQSYSKPGRRLPGGAVDITTTQQSPDALAGKSVRDRIAAMPNTLTKLNTVKRDTRTIDEIRMDLQKKKEGKVLDGDEAKSFDSWFSAKRKDPVKKVQSGSVNNSGANTPTQSQNVSTTAPSSSSSGLTKKSIASSTSIKPAKPSVMKAPIPKSSSQATSGKSANSSRAGSLDKYPAPKASNSQASRSKFASTVDRERDRYGSSRPSSSANMKKRPRSESRSETPPHKRKAPSAEDDLPGDISSTIWSIFGRKRDSYVGMDVFSDDEDMEADADDLEREELTSSRIAKKEDLEALEEERRHEEEKRRRKKERERLTRQ